MRKTSYTPQQIIESYKQLNYKTQIVNILGIRTTINPQQNKFDDTLGLLILEPASPPTLHLYSATTDPGTYWLKNFEKFNNVGTAAVVPGQYIDSHMVGTHINYTAWVQCGTIACYRDGDKDNTLDLDPKTITKGSNYGINVHHAWEKGVLPTVDMWSAGCMVFEDIADWTIVFPLGRQTAAKYKQSRYHLTLFTDTQIAPAQSAQSAQSAQPLNPNKETDLA